jgi:hypothetical protein
VQKELESIGRINGWKKCYLAVKTMNAVWGVQEQLEKELPLREQNLPAFSFSNWSQNGSLTVRHI